MNLFERHKLREFELHYEARRRSKLTVPQRRAEDRLALFGVSCVLAWLGGVLAVGLLGIIGGIAVGAVVFYYSYRLLGLVV